MKKSCIFLLMGAVFVLTLLTGCVEPVVFAEVLQMKKGDKVYTAYNIWYEDPEAIDCRNIQRGSFIPVGTEIIPVETTAWDKIIFKDKAGKKYTICFSSDYRLCPMADYIGYTFTTKSREELLKNVDKKVQLRILRGEVVPGMNTEHVKMAYGLPPAIRTPDLRNESWFYFLNETDTVRVVLRGGIVRNVLNLNEPR
ncbi:MAG: hypothetical protein E7048_01540 [Lentisphaerae bacterium]|nr:hypothetical protein [Lentisphaerota bacterium]MBR2873956.1 hypothetical protein [Lentisphaeria bacterium]